MVCFQYISRRVFTAHEGGDVVELTGWRRRGQAQRLSQILPERGTLLPVMQRTLRHRCMTDEARVLAQRSVPNKVCSGASRSFKKKHTLKRKRPGQLPGPLIKR
jgi:hypothetical protein